MPFLQLTLDIGAADPSPFEDALLAAGALSITLQDAGDHPVLEPAPGTTPLWPSVQVTALFAGTADSQAILAALRSELGEALPAARVAAVADRAWEREWLKDFRPMRFGRRLWICPGGQRPHESPRPDESSRPSGRTDSPSPLEGEGGPHSPQCIVELDPGLAFGTGTHPTTALCLEWLDGADLDGRHVIDYGCGSGVLAIAALKLGAASALAVDIDPQALTATMDNAQRNGVAARMTVRSVEEMPAAPADVLLANILAEPLESLAPRLAGLVLAGGHIVLSGLLSAQADSVAARYAAWFDIATAAARDDWVRLDGIRKPRC